MKTLDNLFLGLMVLLAAIAMSFSGCHPVGSAPAAAQDDARARTRDPVPPSPHLVLARMCAHEASLPVWVVDEESGEGRWALHRNHDVSWGDDCYLIHQVLLRGAERMLEASPRRSFSSRYFAFAVAYSHQRFLVPLPTDGNRWAMDLHPDGHEPQGWHGVAWGHARPAWRFAWELTGGIARMTLEDFEGPGALWTCSEAITDWGGRMDSEHARTVGLIQIACDGVTVNTPYVRPGLR
jgi:hypothetical protein